MQIGSLWARLLDRQSGKLISRRSWPFLFHLFSAFLDADADARSSCQRNDETTSKRCGRVRPIKLSLKLTMSAILAKLAAAAFLWHFHARLAKVLMSLSQQVCGRKTEREREREGRQKSVCLCFPINNISVYYSLFCLCCHIYACHLFTTTTISNENCILMMIMARFAQLFDIFDIINAI